MKKLTAIIPTFNEEHNIEDVIESVSFADEIMVVDSFSTDKTVEIARRYTDFIIRKKYENDSSQKNWAIPQANFDWILLVDADERVSTGLRNEIVRVLKDDPECVAFRIRRSNYFMGKKIRFSGWQGDSVTRLFKRDECRYQNKRVHAEIETAGKIGRLENKLIHNTYTNLASYLEKANSYSTRGAYDRVGEVKKVTFYHLLIKPFFRFLKHYVIRLGFLDGREGFIISVLSAQHVFMRSLKLWRIKKGEEFDKPA